MEIAKVLKVIIKISYKTNTHIIIIKICQILLHTLSLLQ